MSENDTKISTMRPPPPEAEPDADNTLPRAKTQELTYVEAARVMLDVRDEMRGYRREIFEPAGRLDQLFERIDAHGRVSEQQLDLMQGELRTMNETFATALSRINTVDRRLDDLDRRLRVVERERERRDTQPAPAPAPSES